MLLYRSRTNGERCDRITLKGKLTRGLRWSYSRGDAGSVLRKVVNDGGPIARNSLLRRVTKLLLDA